MDRYTLICRLRGPAYILLTGVIAMMAEWTDIGWGKSWPLYIMLEGVLQLAQRWALSNSQPPVDPAAAYPGTYPGSYTGATGAPVPSSTAIVPAPDAPAPPSTDWRS